MAVDLATGGEHQDPELARADEVSCERKERVRFADGQCPIQHLVRQILELIQDAAGGHPGWFGYYGYLHRYRAYDSGGSRRRAHRTLIGGL